MAECRLGALEPGKEADLAVLSQDIVSIAREEIGKTKLWMTMVGGKIPFKTRIDTKSSPRLCREHRLPGNHECVVSCTEQVSVQRSNALHHFGAVSRQTNPTTRDRLHLANSESPDLSQFWPRRQ